MNYARCGNSGLKLPPISLGLWQGFGASRPDQESFEIIATAIASGVTHIDLANNYGPPAGWAEEMFGRFLRTREPLLRDQLIISTKAGYTMWDGPYGDGSSRKYLLASLDQSLRRLGLDYVDIFYSHRFDTDTPLVETMGALKRALDAGKALYVGISSYSAARTAQALAIAADMGLNLTIHQPSYSILNRWIEKPDNRTATGENLLDVISAAGLGCIVFSPLAQGLLSKTYLDGIPPWSRAARNGSFKTAMVTAKARKTLRALNEIAASRGQTLAQLALTWAGRDPRVTSVLIGASSLAQLHENLAMLHAPALSAAELAAIDALSYEADINIWAPRSSNN